MTADPATTPVHAPNARTLPQTTFTPCGWWAHNCSFPTVQFWSKLMSNGDVAVLLMNNGVAPVPLTLEFHAVPRLVMREGSQAAVRDVWARADLGTFDGAFITPPVAPRDAVFLRLKPVTSGAA